MKPVLYMTVGLPATGKSYWAVKKKKEGVAHRSSDDIRLELGFGAGEGSDKVFEILGRRVREDLANGISSIYDATCLTRKRRMAYLETIKKTDCEKIAVLFLCPLAECKRRNMLREGFARVPDFTYSRMLRVFEIPDTFEGFDKVEYVVYDGEYKKTLPDFTELMDFSQDNPHHEHTLGEHMKLVGELMEKKLLTGVPGLTGSDEDVTFRRRCLINAAYNRDIGKVFTKAFKNYKGEPTEFAHFYGHENWGAYLYLTEAGEGFKELLYTALLINWHMKPLNAWGASERKQRKDKEMLEAKYPHLFDDIILLHECDVEAH